MTALALTAAGRTAMADADHTGTEAVTLTHLLLGDALRPAGADDDARVALRNERHRVAVAGQTAADGHVAVAADFTPDASYAITEIGLLATVDGSAVLLAYAAVESAAEAVARAASGTRLVIGVDITITSAAGDLAVTLSPTVSLTVAPDATTAVAGVSRRATGAEAQAAAEAAAEADRAGLEEAAHLTPKEAARIPIELLAAVRGAAPADRDTLAKMGDWVTAQIAAAVALLRGGVAATRDTLSELSAALDRKADKDGPLFSGSPRRAGAARAAGDPLDLLTRQEIVSEIGRRASTLDAAILRVGPDSASIVASSLGGAVAVTDADGLPLAGRALWTLAGGAIYRVTIASTVDWAAAGWALRARVGAHDRVRRMGLDGLDTVQIVGREAVFIETLADPAHAASYRRDALGVYTALIERLRETTAADAAPPGQVIDLEASASALPDPQLVMSWAAPLYGGVVVAWEVQWRGRIDGSGQTSPWESANVHARLINDRYRYQFRVSAFPFAGNDYRGAPWQVRVRGVDAAGNGRWLASPEFR